MSSRDNEVSLTKSQAIASQKIQEYDITFIEGPAGTGKSLTVLNTFLNMSSFGKKGCKIYIIRTPVEAGPDKIGFLPDKLEDKLGPHFGSTQALLKKLIGPARYEAYAQGEQRKIEFLIPNFALGHTFDNALIFIDEAQQLQPNILKLLLERLGRYSKCVVAGDSSQLYLDEAQGKNRQALDDAVLRFFDKRIEEYENGDRELKFYPRYDGVAFHRFDVDDVQRSDIVKTVITAYRGINY